MIKLKHMLGVSLLVTVSLIGIGFSSWYISGGNDPDLSITITGNGVVADDVKTAETYGISFNGTDPGSYCLDYYTYTSGSTTSHYFPNVYLSIHYLVNRTTLSSVPYSEDDSISSLKMGLRYYAGEKSDILQYFQSTTNPSQAILSLDGSDSYQIKSDVTYSKTEDSGLYYYSLETSVPLKCLSDDCIYNLIQNDCLTTDETKIPITLTFPFRNINDEGLYTVLTAKGDYSFSNTDTVFNYYLSVTTE